MPQVVDARAGPGFKMTKPKKIKNGDGKKKSKLKKLHKLKRQSKLFQILASTFFLTLFLNNVKLHRIVLLLNRTLA